MDIYIIIMLFIRFRTEVQQSVLGLYVWKRSIHWLFGSVVPPEIITIHILHHIGYNFI